MAVARVQSKIAGAVDPIAATFDDTPVSGNLLVAFCGERSGATTATISGSGWTQRASGGDFDVQITNGTWRRAIKVWTKTAGASEPKTITLTHTPSVSGPMCIAEYSGVDESDFNQIVVNDDGQISFPPGMTSLASGTTSTLTSGDFLMLSMMYIKSNSNTIVPDGYTMTGGLGNGIYLTDASYSHACAGWGEITTSGTFSTTGTPSWDDTANNRGGVHALMVFDLPAAATRYPYEIHKHQKGGMNVLLTM